MDSLPPRGNFFMGYEMELRFHEDISYLGLNKSRGRFLNLQMVLVQEKMLSLRTPLCLAVLLAFSRS